MSETKKHREYCGVASGECTNPAGYRAGNAVGGNPDRPAVLFECPECGRRACRACREKYEGRVICVECVYEDRWRKELDSKKLSDEDAKRLTDFNA